MSKLILLLFTALLLFLFPNKVFAADVVINEIFANPEGSSEENEFIELYNNTEGNIDLSNWKVSDKVKSYTISGVTISKKSFVSFNLNKTPSNLQLNNSDEEVTLKNASDEIADSLSYETTIEGKTWSRVPDGTGSFENNTDPTEGAPNSAPPPTPTPTPTDSPTPTKTPTPTKAPTPSPSPSTSLKTSTPTQGSSKYSGETANSDLMLAQDANNSDIFKKESPTPSEKPKTEVLGVQTSNTAIIFIALGLIFITACGIIAYFQFGDKLFVWKRRNL